MDNLENKDRNIQGDCIKTLYETGYRNRELIAGYLPNFLALLTSENNRMVWGGMIALTTIAERKHKEAYLNIIKKRQPECEKSSQSNHLEGVLKKMKQV